MDQIRADIQALKDDLSELGGSLGDLSSEAAADVRKRARRAGERTKSQLDAAQGRIESEIEDRPLTSVLTSFGLGFVVGMMLDRRR